MDESQGRLETKSGKLNELGKLSGSRAVKLNRSRHGGCNRSVSPALIKDTSQTINRPKWSAK